MDKRFFFVLLLLLVSFLTGCIPLGMSFTVIMSDSNALIDGPQTGFSMNNNNKARTNQREQSAVYDIMKATGNEWATGIPDICRGRWHGIECMPDRDNVYHVVSLSFGSLSDDTAFPTCDPTRSFISPSITKLPHLRTLFFYRCFTHNPQPIPEFLGQLGSTLLTLVLRENGHVGPIPYQLGNLTRLTVLDLHKNNLNGSIPGSLGRIAGLKSLDLSGNRLSGSIPNLSLPLLNVLDLNQNDLTGSIPTSLGNCWSLIKLDMSRNHLSGLIPESFESLNNLILMDLSHNHLSGPLPKSLKWLISLQALILNHNPTVSATIPEDAFDGLADLMILIMSDMNLHGEIPESLGRLTSLRVLHLDGNHLSGPIPVNFRRLSHLSELRLNSNQLSGSIPLGREVVWRMRRKLRLENNYGLCFEASDGFGDDLDSLFGSSIGLCETLSSESPTTVQHFSMASEDPMPTSVNKSTSVAHKYSVHGGLLSALFFLFIISLML